MEDFKNHFALTLLKNSKDKLICHDELIGVFSIIELKGQQLTFSTEEAIAFAEYVNKVQADKSQQQISDFENSIKQSQQWINEYKKDLSNIDSQIAEADKQLKDAFSAVNADLVTTYNTTLQALGKERTEIIHKISTQENYVEQYQAEIIKLKK